MSELPKEIEERVHHLLPSDLLHDLRTPLGHILGYSEIVIEQMQDKGEDQYLPQIEKIRAAGYKLLEMFQDNFEAVRKSGS